MAPLNSPYFTSHECIFLGCLELYYRSRYTTFNFCTSFFRLVSKINDNCDFKTVHLTPTRMAPLNSTYFTSYESIFLGCLELHYRSRYRHQAGTKRKRESLQENNERKVGLRGFIFARRKHRYTFPRRQRSQTDAYGVPVTED